MAESSPIQTGQEVTAVYRVDRTRCGESSGHWGSFSCKRLDVEQNYWADPYVEDIIGRNLTDGSVIEVTVRIIKEMPWPPTKKNFWHEKNHPQYCEPCRNAS